MLTVRALRVDGARQYLHDAWVWFRAFRRTRPFWGGLWLIVGGWLVAVPGADGELHYLGRAGSGIAPGDIDDIARTLAGIERKTPPVARIPDADRRDARWVTPTLVGEVAYSELTPQGRLRAPSWRGWRPDLSASDVRWEGAGALPTP